MSEAEIQPRRVEYDDNVVRAFSIITIVWGAVALLLGVIVATQISFWQANLGTAWLTFGRLRPLHTNAVIFAFGGNALICTSFYIVQRTSAARLWGGNLAWYVFWGYQLFIVMAASGYLLNATGFDVELEGNQTERAIILMRLFDAGIPMVTSAIAIWAATPRGSPVAASHRRTEPSCPKLASWAPSARNRKASSPPASPTPHSAPGTGQRRRSRPCCGPAACPRWLIRWTSRWRWGRQRATATSGLEPPPLPRTWRPS